MTQTKYTRHNTSHLQGMIMKDVMHVITLLLLLARSKKPTKYHMDTGSDESEGNWIILEI